MKLVLIITDYGSFNNFLTELATTLSDMPDIELTIICSENKVIKIADKAIFQRKFNFRFVDIPRTITIAGEWSAAKKIRQILTEIKPDLVHSHFTTATFPVILFKVSKISYWATFHGLGMNASTGFKRIIFSIVEMLCFLSLKKVFTVNQKDYNLVKKYFNSKVSKYDCLGFGCDVEKFNLNTVTTSTISKFREKYLVKQNSTVISFTGRYVNFKGFDLVIKSFKVLSENYPNKFKLILMGGPDPIHSTGLNQQEENFYRTSDDIIDIGFTNEVEKYLAITDIFLFPSKKEGLPTCILEALSMGIPIITFRARGNEDVIIHEYNGLLLDAGFGKEVEVKMICDNIIYLSNNKAECFKFKTNALKDRYKYDRIRFVDEHVQYYDNFLKCN